MKAVALEIQNFPLDPALHAAGLDSMDATLLADKTFEVKLGQEFAEPGVEKLLPALGCYRDRDLFFGLNFRRISDESVKRLSS